MILAIAHRGASGRLPENSMAAFDEAVRAGADIIEFDVRFSADGRLVVIHDETLERTHRRPERVDALRAADLGRLGVPLLEDVLDAFGRAAILDIELKSFGKRAVVALAAATRDRLLKDRWIATSFDRATTEIAAAAHLPVGILYAKPLGDEVDLGRHLGARALVARYSAVNPALIAAARRANLEVWAWTLDDCAEIERFARMGCAAVASNHPERVIAVRDRLR